MRLRTFIPFVFLPIAAFGQLSPQQKVDDFRSLVSIYNKQYAPYEWKRDNFGFDLLDTRPWIAEIERSASDLEYYEILGRYVASLRDSHARYIVPSNFSASLGFNVDIYDGRVLIDNINRVRLPLSRFPFQIGDEFVSMDGVPVAEWIDRLLPLHNNANPAARRRAAADAIVNRAQERHPRAVELGDVAQVVIKRRATGELETYLIPWVKSGVPLVSLGPLPNPRAAERPLTIDFGYPEYMKPLEELWWVSTETPRETVLNSGGLAPVFALPEGFQQRLGRNSNDPFFSGVYTAGGKRIGFIRIPRMTPPAVQVAPGVFVVDISVALGQFANEIVYFSANTDGLVVDVMRNPGGLATYVEELCRFVIPDRFRSLGFEFRPTWNSVRSLENSLAQARAFGAERWQIDLIESYLGMIRQAYSENRGRTGAIPLGLSLDVEPARSSTGQLIAYNKPLIVLADEFSGSGGDMFPAILQDAARGPIVGMRTSGAGGSVLDIGAGPYSEGTTRVTNTLMNRKTDIITTDLLPAPYVENIGVRPDIQLDYMTEANLLQGGRPFVQAFTEIMLREIEKRQ